MKAGNTHTTRESWLRSATNELRPYFSKLGYELPEKIRFAIAFTSTGKRGHMAGECWHPASSADGHYEIIIRADIADPAEVLGILVHELVHTLLPPEVKHGKEFRAIALRIGLEGKMRETTPTPILAERLNAIAINLGALPHAKLNFSENADAPKKQKTRWLKAECGAACGYSVQITAKWARAGLPICPIDTDHGALICNLPDDGKDEEITMDNKSDMQTSKAILRS
ncbi:MAG: transcription elongation protein SprT [Alphaproteobacteria bacterium]